MAALAHLLTFCHCFHSSASPWRHQTPVLLCTGWELIQWIIDWLFFRYLWLTMMMKCNFSRFLKVTSADFTSKTAWANCCELINPRPTSWLLPWLPYNEQPLHRLEWVPPSIRTGLIRAETRNRKFIVTDRKWGRSHLSFYHFLYILSSITTHHVRPFFNTSSF